MAVSDFATKMAGLAHSVSKSVAMIYVSSVVEALDWYTSIGFTELTRFEDEGEVNFGMVAFGKAELMFNPFAAGIEFGQHIEDMFYGARQFSIRDPDGYELYVIQSLTPQAE